MQVECKAKLSRSVGRAHSKQRRRIKSLAAAPPPIVRTVQYKENIFAKRAGPGAKRVKKLMREPPNIENRWSHGYSPFASEIRQKAKAPDYFSGFNIGLSTRNVGDFYTPNLSQASLEENDGTTQYIFRRSNENQGERATTDNEEQVLARHPLPLHTNESELIEFNPMGTLHASNSNGQPQLAHNYT